MPPSGASEPVNPHTHRSVEEIQAAIHQQNRIIIDEAASTDVEALINLRGTRIRQYQWNPNGVAPSRVASTTSSPPRDLSSERERALELATIRLVDARANTLDRLNASLPRERRESEYLDLIRDDLIRNLTTQEVTNSEIPVHLDSIDFSVVHDIANRGHRDIVDVEGNRTHFDFVCATCHTSVPTRFAFMCLGRLYCAEHVPKAIECISCHAVGPNCGQYVGPEGNKINVCSHCAHRMVCNRCDRRVPPNMAESRQCESCYKTPATNAWPRSYARNANWMSKDITKLVPSNRVFSCELETVVPSNRAVAKLLELTPPEVGMTGDGSIRANSGNGVELQTPRLQGSRGEELVTRVVAALKSVGAALNESCGFHIHLDATDLIPTDRNEYPAAIIQLWKAHLVFEDVILSFLPYKRRMNRYCRSMRDYFKMSDLNLVTSIFDIEKLWYKQRSYSALATDKGHHFHPSRYFGFNLHSLLGERNLEIRYHSGTLNAKKVFHWVALHSLIMDAASAGYFDGAFLDEAQATMDLREKTEMLFEHIGLKNRSTGYFLERQRRFGDKTQGEDDGVVLPNHFGEVTLRQPRFVMSQTVFESAFRDFTGSDTAIPPIINPDETNQI